MVLTNIGFYITAVRDSVGSDIKDCIILHQGALAGRDFVLRLLRITPPG